MPRGGGLRNSAALKPNISSERVQPPAAEFLLPPVWMGCIDVSLHADLHGISWQQMDPTGSEVKIVSMSTAGDDKCNFILMRLCPAHSQVVNAVFIVVVLAPQIFVMGR